MKKIFFVGLLIALTIGGGHIASAISPAEISQAGLLQGSPSLKTGDALTLGRPGMVVARKPVFIVPVKDFPNVTLTQTSADNSMVWQSSLSPSYYRTFKLFVDNVECSLTEESIYEGTAITDCSWRYQNFLLNALSGFVMVFRGGNGYWRINIPSGTYAGEYSNPNPGLFDNRIPPTNGWPNIGSHTIHIVNNIPATFDIGAQWYYKEFVESTTENPAWTRFTAYVPSLGQNTGFTAWKCVPSAKFTVSNNWSRTMFIRDNGLIPEPLGKTFSSSILKARPIQPSFE